jgi:hypothetical protein
MMKTRMSIETQNMDTGPAEQFQSWLGQKIKNYMKVTIVRIKAIKNWNLEAWIFGK